MSNIRIISKVQQKNLSTDHPEVVIIHNNLDSLYSELDQYDLMMEHLNQSLNIQPISIKIELVLLNWFVSKKYKKFVYIIEQGSIVIPRQNSSYKILFFSHQKYLCILKITNIFNLNRTEKKRINKTYNSVLFLRQKVIWLFDSFTFQWHVLKRSRKNFL